MAQLCAEASDLVGVAGITFFVTADGKLLADSLTPHPHPSANWSIDACTCSQFEQQVRIAASMQIGSPNRHADSVTYNLIGPESLRVNRYMEMPKASLHLYGKLEARDGRHMGHVTILDDKISRAMLTAKAV